MTRHTDKVTCIALTSKHIYTGSEDGQARQFEYESGESP